MLRFEAIAHNTAELRCGRMIEKFPEIVTRLAGAVVVDPDAEVQAAIRDLFAAFAACGSAYGVVAAFAGRGFRSAPTAGCGPGSCGGAGCPMPGCWAC